MSTPNIFISYSHQDAVWKEKLVKHLAVLSSESMLTFWDDSMIEVGADWQQQIENALDQATVAILMISASFLISEFIKGVELPRLLAKRKEKDLLTIPLIVRPCAWQEIGWLSKIQAWPHDARPLSKKKSAEVDDDLANLTKEIVKILIARARDQGAIPRQKRNPMPGITPKKPRPVQKIITDDAANFVYLANRYGYGYRYFELKCMIDYDGSARVFRDVMVEAFGVVSEIDTMLRIPEKDPEGRTREIGEGEEGIIKSNDNRHKLTLEVVDNKPGTMVSKINIEPPLQAGESLPYSIYSYRLPKGLFAIGLTRTEYRKRTDQTDYFAWHINRPTEKFVIEVMFPFGNLPLRSWSEVKYAASAGTPADQAPHTEQRRLNKPIKIQSGDLDTLKFTVEYPMSGMIYFVKWKPKVKSS